MGSAARFAPVLVLASLLVLAAGGRDLYKILEIDKGADEATIKRAYRKLALCAPALPAAASRPAAAARRHGLPQPPPPPAASGRAWRGGGPEKNPP